MRVAFYAPMKAPTDPVPSGDRKIARLFIRALDDGGHDVMLASRFRSWEGQGDEVKQQRLRNVGCRLATRVSRHYCALPAGRQPEAWFTYHLYHKAPDWLGPAVSRQLGIPYVVAEASYAPKQAAGPWAMGLEAAATAIASAAAILALKSYDIPCLLPLLDDPRRLVRFKPFLDASEHAQRECDEVSRRELQQHFGLDNRRPWLLTVAMMRYGNKLACYEVLGQALRRLTGQPVSLLIVGDGPARAEVQAAFKGIEPHQVIFAGLQSQETLQAFYGAADLFAWPAVDEPFGMALLEAQAAGLPVVAGASRGVPDVVHQQVSGVLVPPGNVDAFADALAALLENRRRLGEMGAAAKALVAKEHDIRSAASKLNAILERVRAGEVP
ncbi:MAG: glycosyltransferase family 4 protein [Acidiferrobacterales bacterium]